MTHVASTTRPLHNKIIKKGRTNTATLATATATSHGNCNASHIAVDFDVNFDGDAGGGNGDGDGNGDVDVSSCCSLSLATRVQSCSFYRARARANKGQRRHNKATSHHSLTARPSPSVHAVSPGAALIIFMLPRQSKRGRQRRGRGKREVDIKCQ